MKNTQEGAVSPTHTCWPLFLKSLMVPDQLFWNSISDIQHWKLQITTLLLYLILLFHVNEKAKISRKACMSLCNLDLDQNKESESDKMPAESFSLCVDCIQQKSQEELELSRRSRQIDRCWSKIFSEFKVHLCTFNNILEFISSAAWFSFAIQLFRDLKREERLIRRQVYNW